MTDYYIGDIHGCHAEFAQLIQELDVQANDEVFLAGDLVNRGPDSLETLKLAKDRNFKMVLGNHDLYLLASYFKKIPKEYSHTFHRVLADADCDDLISWLLQQPLYHYQQADNFLLVHAGLYPFWELEQALTLADDACAFMRTNPHKFFDSMFGQEPKAWGLAKTRLEQHRFIINAFTRMRYVNVNGLLDFNSHKPPPNPKSELKPWFELLPKSNLTIAFGHWSALGGFEQSSQIIALDGGCVWGEQLLAWAKNTNDWVAIKRIKATDA